MMGIIGIDPGIEGAIAYVAYDHGEVTKSVVADLAMMPDDKGNPSKRLDIIHVSEFISYFSPRIVVVEEPFFAIDPRHKTSTSTKSIKVSQQNYGRIQAAIELANCYWTSVSPYTWKKKLGLTKEKGDSLGRSRSLFPLCGADLKRQKDHNRAEALLLAQYGYQYIWLESAQS